MIFCFIFKFLKIIGDILFYLKILKIKEKSRDELLDEGLYT